MDWELKTSAWNFTESSREDEASLAALAGSSSSLGVHNNAGGFSVDLKLGGLGDFGVGSVDKLKEPRGSRIVPSPSGSSKKTRAATNRTQNVWCLVDGCTANLSNCREYHRRHRVCERHSKTPVVVVRGKEQRFCQQCSRFQSLGEFDEEKRSCRKRLEGHNRRRRKPQPEAFYMSSGNISSNHQGARLLQFSGPQPYTTSTAGSVPSWPPPRVVKQHQELHISDQQSTIPNSLAWVYNGGGGDKRFPFLLANDPERSNQAVPDIPVYQRLVDDRGLAESGRGHQKIFSDGLTQSVNPKRALSLLSTYPKPSIHPTQTLGTSFSHLLVQRDVMNLNQPIGTSLHFDGLVQNSRSQGMGARPPVLVPPASNPNSLCNEIFQVVPDDMLETGASQVLPFSWK